MLIPYMSIYRLNKSPLFLYLRSAGLLLFQFIYGIYWQGKMLYSSVFLIEYRYTIHVLILNIHSLHKKWSSINDFYSKCDLIRRKLRIWSHLLYRSLTGNLIFCAVHYLQMNFWWSHQNLFQKNWNINHWFLNVSICISAPIIDVQLH